MLYLQTPVESSTVHLPNGDAASFEVVDAEMKESEASCCVVKDAGDDPDVTDGLKICASVRKSPRLELKGGRGVGVVTLPGLAVPVGEPAINPGPRRMILEAVAEVLPGGAGAEIEIFVPNGEKVAERTFNPRLGIIGGISIIGTTGIVRPMSAEAYKESLALQLDVAAASGRKMVVLVPGNVGERAALRLGFDEGAIVHMGNHVGFMLDRCVERDISAIFLLGHVGKMLKIADGAFDTHNRRRPLDLGVLAKLAEAASVDEALVERVKSCATAEEAASTIGTFEAVFDRLADEVALRATERVGGTAVVAAGVVDLKGNLLGGSGEAKRILEAL